jgi:hypothetical protein
MIFLSDDDRINHLQQKAHALQIQVKNSIVVFWVRTTYSPISYLPFRGTAASVFKV